MSSQMNPSSALRTLLFTSLLLLAAAAGAQACITEQEPNDTPSTANPISSAACVAGVLSDSDQDAFAWTVTEDDAARPWRLELEGVPRQLTTVEIFRVEFAANGVDVIKSDSLMIVSTRDGRLVTDGPHLFAAGTYILGMSSSGSGPYSLVLAEDPYLRPYREVGEAGAEPLQVDDDFNESGQLHGSQAFTWTVSEEVVDHLWRVEVATAVGEPLTLSINRPDGTLLTKLNAGSPETVSVGRLAVPSGTYLLQVTPAGGGPAPFRLTATSQGVVTDGQEIEPNDSFATGNVIAPGQELRGVLGSGGDTDYFRFTVHPEHAGRLFDLETGATQNAEACLLDGLGDTVQCRSGVGVKLPALHLPEGEYGVRLKSKGNEADVPYTLLLRDVGEPKGGVATEPNDGTAWAFPLPEEMAVRGELYGEDTDYFRVEITGEPQLWRVQVIGEGISELKYYALSGRDGVRERGESRLRLNNLYLLPGTHFVSISGDGGKYAVRLLPLGQPDGEPPLQATGDGVIAAIETAPEEETATLPKGPRPEGITELEPNDDTSRADLLIFSEPRVGLLTSGDDVDVYRFFLAEGQHVRLQVQQPADAAYVADLYWGSEQMARVQSELGAVISGQEWLPAGDYHLFLSARTPSDEYYQVTLERLDPFTVPAGRDAHYPEWFGRNEDAEEAETAEPAELDLGLELTAVATASPAAYWPYAQELQLQLDVTNPSSSTVVLEFDWHSSAADWRPNLPEQLTIGAGQQLRLPVALQVAPDAPDAPVVVTVRARTANGRQKTAAVTLTPTSSSEPVASHLSWPMPKELLGGLNAAWLDLGAELVYASEDEETVAERFALTYLLDGMTPLDHDYFNYRMWDRIPRDLDMDTFLPTIRLAGTDAVEVAGFLLNPLASEELSRSLREFAVHLSLDGNDFTKVFEGTLSARQVEQAFVLPEPIKARYARLELLSNQNPDASHQDADFRVGTFKVVATRGSAAVISAGAGLDSAGLNIASPNVGGHMVWSDPPGVAHSSDMLLDNDKYPDARQDFDQEDSTWVIGFLNNRAAQITELHWADHPSSEEGGYHDIFKTVELSVATESPAGPFTPIGTWNLDRSDAGVAPFVLDEPVWARFVRFRATGLTPRGTYDYPNTVRIIERAADEEYSSILGEWGHYSKLGIYEQLHDVTSPTARTVSGNSTRDAAEDLTTSAVLQGAVELGVNDAWYRFTVPTGKNHISVTLTGQPNRGFDHELLDEAGNAVTAHETATPTEIVLSASVQPGDYWLRLYEPPRSVIIAWDTSGSVSASLPVIYQALARFAESISPGVEEVNLLPFDSPFLLRSWSGDPQRVLQAINDDPRNTSSSSGETALLTSSLELAARPGKKAVILLTDGAVPRDGALWRTLLAVKPHVFSSEITAAGDLVPNARHEQHLMQDYASVNGGHYEYVRTQGDFDETFRRAAAWLRRPSRYSVSLETSQQWARASAWAEPELERARDRGLIPESLAGADLTAAVTRAEFAAVAVKVFEALTGTEAVRAAVNPFTDTHDVEVLKAFNTGLAVGVSETEFAPEQLLNREQAATILTRVFKKVNLSGWTWADDAQFELDFEEKDPFSDDERISPWARESVYFMAANGIITGTGDGQFQPRAVTPEEAARGYANATREQALLLAVRLVESQ